VTKNVKNVFYVYALTYSRSTHHLHNQWRRR